MDAKKLLLLGGLGFVVYEFWGKIAPSLGLPSGGVSPTIIPVNVAPTTTTQPKTTTTNAVVVNNNPPTYDPVVAPPPLTNLYSELRRYVSSNPAYSGGATFDQWNYAVRAVGGSIDAAIEDIFPGMDRGTVISLDQYWTGLNSAGLAGLRGGLGQIFDSSDFLSYYDSNYMEISGKEYI